MNNFFRLVKFLVFLFLAFSLKNTVAEQIYIQNYENGSWKSDENSFYCRLGQRLDGYASIELVSLPSEPQKLIFKWLISDKNVTDVRVLSRKADWQSKNITPPHLNLFTADITKNTAAFSVDESAIIRVIKQGGWLDSIVGFGDDQLRLTFTNIHSDEAINKYQHCLANLSPLSWKAARDHEIHFGSGKRVVDKEEDLIFLRNLVRYISLDKDVTKVMIDGHTDNVGSPLANRLLSKERADDVAARLVEFGLPKSMLEVRAHGQRYPVVESSAAGVASNRRVLIRLFRHSN